MRKVVFLFIAAVVIMFLGRIILLGVGAASGTSTGTYSEGSRVGQIVKFSKRGYLAKSWEGELLMGGLKTVRNTDSEGNSSYNTVANVFEFSCTNPSIATKIEEIMSNGGKVKLHYVEYIIPNPAKMETSYDIRDVEVVE
jgi:hypothetical protein